MSRFTKLGIIGGVYVVLVLFLINSAMSNATGLRLLRSGSGLFTMYGLAVLGVSIVAGTIVLVVARERE